MFRKICKRCIIGFIMLLCIGVPVQAASYETYTYSYMGEEVASLDAYTPDMVLDFFSEECGTLNKPQDVFVAPDGNIYLADTGNNRILVLNKSFQYQYSIEQYVDDQGKTQQFLSPSGVFVTADGTIYVADSDHAQIVILNADKTFKGRIVSPKGSGIPENFVFQPYSLVVDKRGRSYVISLHNTSGVMTFSEKGEFNGFIGAQNTSPSIADLFLRLFMTKEQKERMKASIPAEYSNIAMDRDEFFYVTDATLDQATLQSLINSRSTSATYSPIKKLNPSGVDVMTRTGFFPPVGDVKIPFGSGNQYGGSQIIDVAVCHNGLFSLADGKRNKIFTYDEEGNLLYAFSGTGTSKGRFQSLVSLAYQGENLLGLDSQAGTLTVFRLTEYGKFINQAIALYASNDFDGAANMWSEVAEYNNNLDIAYIGVGNNLYNSGEYEEAMKYYKSASNVTNYSKAMGKYREQWMEKFFWLIPVILIVVIFLAVKVSALIRKKNTEGDFGGRQNCGTQLMYAQRVLFHPFDAFYEIKRHGRGGMLSATILLVATVLVYLIYNLFSGYIFRASSMESFSLFSGIFTVLLPVILFVVANWCFTCLMNGEGNMRQIYITTCYSLTPMIILYPIATVVSNVLLQGESAFVSMLLTIALVWTILLLFVGMLTIHNYSPGANLVTCLLTILGMIIILFICVLFVGLIQRMLVFFFNIYNEIAFR